jgi:hypothetical protein
MSDFDPQRDPFRELWTGQPLEPVAMSVEAMHARARRFQARVRGRNLTEYAAAALVMVVFGRLVVEAPAWPARLGGVLIALGAVYVCVRLHLLARAAGRDELARVESWADFHRAELVRQRDALHAVWRWYLGPLVPGLAVFCLTPAFIPDKPLLVRTVGVVAGLAICAATVLGVWRLNARAADALQREIDDLDALRASTGDADPTEGE